jgi:hypothetical protein
MRRFLGRDGRRFALIVALTVAGGACGGGGGGGGPGDASADEAIDGGDGEEDAIDMDVPPPVCPVATGEIVNAACNELTAGDVCVAPLMVEENAPGPAGGALVDGTYDLTERIVYTNPGGATGSAGEPLAQTIVLAAAKNGWSMDDATLSAATASRHTMSLTTAGVAMQLRATPTCPSADSTDAGTGGADAGASGAIIYYTATDGTLSLYYFRSSGPIQADTYTLR